MDTIRVIARDDARLPFRDELGRMHPARWAGRDSSGKPAAELVPDGAYYRRAVARGDLELVPEAPTPETSTATPEVAAATVQES